ncbi:calcium-binding protein [Tropicimonas aquimaris]|uniref:Calcium-binding protein n=1 Tax=Tropicimonas aquimaris TaxID=914152 RepID=A0ABW3INE9_9RHOB
MPMIYVEARPVALGLVPLGADHLYLVYRSDFGQDYVIGGGPDGPEGVVGGGFDIQVNQPIESSPEARGGESPSDRDAVALDFPDLTVDEAWALMVRYARMIDEADIRYDFTSTNSNALIGALVEAAGGDDDFPPDTGSPLGPVGLSSAEDILSSVTPPADGVLRGTAADDSFVMAEVHGEEIRGRGGDDLLVGGGGDDSLYGGADDDVARGGTGSDLLAGQRGADRLFGGRGSDTLAGGAQADLLNGGLGADVLTGGGGADRFIFSAKVFGQDIIADFRPVALGGASDLLVLSTDEVADADAFLAACREEGGDTVFDAGGDGLNTITLAGVSLSDLGAADLEFV